jgi:hypothetical protein
MTRRNKRNKKDGSRNTREASPCDDLLIDDAGWRHNQPREGDRKMIKLVKIVGTAAVLSGFAMPMAVAGDTNGTEHSTHIECYASVTNQCNGAGGCSDADYNWGLDQCDSIYEQSSSRPLNVPPNNFKAATTGGKKFMRR